MQIISSAKETQKLLLEKRKSAQISFVPTMGCLHEGHLQLIRMAKRNSDFCVVSIFVNPLQFGKNEDFGKYGRPFEEDCQKLRAEGVDLLFHPTPQDMYGDNFSARVSMQGTLPQFLCGSSRPGHFEGVATVCLKLFQIVQPHTVVFGEKDFQQVRVVEKMIEDLNLPIQLIRHATVRESDGLAFSSRNTYLSPEERVLARGVPQTLNVLKTHLLRNPFSTAEDCLRACQGTLPAGSTLDYLSIASEIDLVPLQPGQALRDVALPRAFIALKIGTTRLIDNLPLYIGCT